LISGPASRACRLAHGAVDVAVAVVGKRVVVRRYGERVQLDWHVLGSLDHRLCGLSRRLHLLLLAWVAERRDRIDWRMLGSLGHGLYGLDR
jgi:hypothetical protein